MKNTQSPPSFQNLLWLLASVLKVTPWLATGWLLGSLIMAGVSASELLVLRETVNTLVGSDTWHASVPWLVTLCLLFLSQRAIAACLPLLREQLRIKAGYALQHAALEKIGKLPLEAFDEEDSHNLINRVAASGDTSLHPTHRKCAWCDRNPTNHPNKHHYSRHDVYLGCRECSYRNASTALL